MQVDKKLVIKIYPLNTERLLNILCLFILRPFQGLKTSISKISLVPFKSNVNIFKKFTLFNFVFTFQYVSVNHEARRKAYII